MEYFRIESQLRESQALLSPENIESTAVYPVIHMIRADVMHFIDTPLTYEALVAPDLTYTLIRPLHEKYQSIQHPESGDPNYAIPFAFLINRVHFLRDTGLSTRPVSRTRAVLCEILAIRLLRDHGNNILTLAIALTTSWNVFSGADEDTIKYAEEELNGEIPEKVGNAIEIAIIGRAKRFIKGSSCQRVIDGIWTGRCVYQAQSSHSILSDTYKQKSISFYDPHKAPLLDHYRLKVPAIRSVLEYWNFVLLFILFIVAIETVEPDYIGVPEAIFMVYALGFTLEKVAAMQEHGIQVYSKGTWNGFDLALISIYFVYAFVRLYGNIWNHDWARKFGVDCMAIIACLLFPRLAFVTLRNNLMVLALRAMILQFIVLMAIACFCFGGFLYALWILSRTRPFLYTPSQIAWWMLDLWFGLDAAGFVTASDFHPFFGPILMVEVTYASLSNTLLLTVLVSILSNTFAVISEDAVAEAMFRKAVSTIEGVKADSLFSYQPPMNLLALVLMLPSSWVLSPRWFHKMNVLLIRLLNFPLLLMIAVYERTAKRLSTNSFSETALALAEELVERLPRVVRVWGLFEALMSSDTDIDLIFEIEEEIGSALVIDEDDVASPYRFEVPNSPARVPRRGSKPSNQAPSPGASGARLPSPSARGEEPRHGFYRQRAGGPHHPPTSPLPLRQRTRMPSLLNRGAEAVQHFTSPLAQIYQPLVVDDNASEDNDNSSQHTGSPQRERKNSHTPVPVPVPMIGLRRRISSTKPRQPSDTGAGANTSGGLKFPTIGEHAELGSSENVFSESPEPNSLLGGREGGAISPTPSASQSKIVTTEQFAEGETGPSSIAQLDDRQKKMEAMLAQLLAEVKDLKRKT